MQYVNLLIGILVIIFRKPYSRLIISFHNYGSKKPYGEKELKGTEIVAIVVGISFILLSLVDILGLITV